MRFFIYLISVFFSLSSFANNPFLLGGTIEDKITSEKLGFECASEASKDCNSYKVFLYKKESQFWEYYGVIQKQDMDKVRRASIGKNFSTANKLLFASNLFLTFETTFRCGSGSEVHCASIPLAIVADILKFPATLMVQLGANIYISLSSLRFRTIGRFLINKKYKGKSKKINHRTFFYLLWGLKKNSSNMNTHI